MKTLTRLTVAALGLALGTCAASAANVIYDLTGYTNVGGATRSFTGVFEYEDSVLSDTVYFNGSTIPQQGFRSSYFNSVRRLTISLSSGESVTCTPGGYIDVNNMQQVEPGSQVPAGLTVQAWAGNSAGTINNLSIHYMYLAFLPVNPNFSWQGLDSFFNGNAESMLQANPNLLPHNIDPALTGTTLSPSIQRLASSLFLGTIHTTAQGTTTTVNTINSFQLRVPSPGTAMCLGLLGGVASIGRKRTGR